MTRQRGPLQAAVIALALSCTATQARVTQFVVESATPLEGGVSYGQVGPYVRIRVSDDLPESSVQFRCAG